MTSRVARRKTACAAGYLTKRGALQAQNGAGLRCRVTTRCRVADVSRRRRSSGDLELCSSEDSLRGRLSADEHDLDEKQATRAARGLLFRVAGVLRRPGLSRDLEQCSPEDSLRGRLSYEGGRAAGTKRRRIAVACCDALLRCWRVAAPRTKP